jgi:uncharacterized protein (UPF0335 family)
VFIPESQRAEPRPPKITWISSFDANRTDAQIIASNRENQVRKERLAREQAEREEKVKEAYRTLGRATGLDVDAMERRIAAEKAAEEAAAKARAARTQAD